ncbi:SdpI family protein [Bizionia paragorgiae]|uniref:SdpI/YhfL protein family protein n=1 Tax=Bizionia paragorgiae TaxID=283786 RepID=A0A1H3Z8K5_BIZPA|nr:SdpI family protein [Bizionia paragorgiae]SEA20007.1 SdpI/YhfL protein family protein [Bizionia paragorgiae]
MSFTDSILTMLGLVGIIFFAVGVIMLLFPPKKINVLYGYRTTRSMKNQEQWDFAQNYSSKLLIIFGAVLALLSLLGYCIDISDNTEAIMSTILIIGTVILILIKTEKAIKTKFNG